MRVVEPNACRRSLIHSSMFESEEHQKQTPTAWTAKVEFRQTYAYRHALLIEKLRVVALRLWKLSDYGSYITEEAL